MAGATGSRKGQEGAPRGAGGSRAAAPGLWACGLREAFLLGPAPQDVNPSCFAFSLPFHRLRPLTSWSRTERHRLRGMSHPARRPRMPPLGQH